MLEVNSVSLSRSFPSHSCTVSSAGLRPLCWLCSGIRDAHVPPEKLRAVLMLDETGLCCGRLSLSSIRCLGTNATEYTASDSTFVVVRPFHLFSQVVGFWFFFSWFAAVTADRQVKRLKDLSKRLSCFEMPSLKTALLAYS